MDKDKLQGLISKNYSTSELSKELNKSQTTIRYWLKKYNLKTNFRYQRGGWKRALLGKDWDKQNVKKGFDLSKFNWKDIQTFYDAGHSSRDVTKKFSISPFKLWDAKYKGLFNTRDNKTAAKLAALKNIGRKMPEQTKRKLSIARKNFLTKNPESLTWKTANKNFSVPCEFLKTKLATLNIKYTEEYQPLIHVKRFFSIDIAFPDIKLGIEINGGQHYDTNSNLKPYYQERHDLILSHGWMLYEIPYRKAFNLTYILSLLSFHNIHPNQKLLSNGTPGET